MGEGGVGWGDRGVCVSDAVRGTRQGSYWEGVSNTLYVDDCGGCRVFW